MKRYKTLTIIILLNLLPMIAVGQGMGCIYDEEADGKAQQRPRLMTRDYTILPEAYSIKQFCPTPKSQGGHGTCTAWSTTYGARTICEAINNNWTNADSISEEAFAPIFIYKQLDSTLECRKGISIYNALELLQEKGAPKLNSFDVLCADSIPLPLFAEAARYKIDAFTQLYNDYIPKGKDKVAEIKKALCENHPVVFCLQTYRSFHSIYKDSVWNGQQDSIIGLHAMCVIGYDDTKYGGAFEILNSWGQNWGMGGFIWIKYEDLVKNSVVAYDVYLKKKPAPTPIPRTKKYTMAGSMSLVGKDGGDISPVTIDSLALLPAYLMKEKYLSGKRFRIEVSNNEPAWVYVIASDQTNQVNVLFPYADNICPHLNYSQNDIAIPDETHLFELDTVAGTDYFCVLYSQEELDIHDITTQIQNASGTFYQKLASVMGDALAPRKEIGYASDKIAFTAKTDNPVVPLIVEIPHKGIGIRVTGNGIGH